MIVSAALLCSVLTAPQGDGPQRFAGAAYSFACPDGWVLASKETIDEVRREVGATPMLENVDLQKVDALVFDPEVADTFASVNFVTADGRMAVDDAGAERLRKELTDGLASLGVDFRSDLTVACSRVGDAACYEVAYDALLPTAPAVMRQRQLLVPLGAQVLTVTMTATQDAFASVEPSFAALLSTLQVEASGGLVDAWRSLPRMVRSGVIGGVIGGAIALVMSRRRRSQRAAAAAAEGDA